MNGSTPTIAVPVDPANPGQFFACCGLLELATLMDAQAEAWFSDGQFNVVSTVLFGDVISRLRQTTVDNTMTAAQKARLDELSKMKKKDRESIDSAEEEKKSLESLRRESPIVLAGGISLLIDWFTDGFAGGSRFKTWAGQQSVIEIARAMHGGLSGAHITDESTLWNNARRIGLPFFFDSDLGAQGSALDIGFSFDPLSGTEGTRIEMASRPALELLAFIGLQRFRPREVTRKNRFVYVAWPSPLPVSIAAAAACQALACREAQVYEFRLLYRTKYLKSFLPAIPFQGDRDE
jgi:CRISPR-associated protein Csb3